MDERGSVKAWVLAFLIAAPLSFGALVGIGCLIGANACPFSDGGTASVNGREIWVANCQVCHGPDATGTGHGPSLQTDAVAALDRDELEAKIADGRPFFGMPRFEGVLTSDQIEAVAEYVLTLRGEPDE